MIPGLEVGSGTGIGSLLESMGFTDEVAEVAVEVEPPLPDLQIAEIEETYEEDNILAYHKTAYKTPFTLIPMDREVFREFRKLNYNCWIHPKTYSVTGWKQLSDYQKLADWYDTTFTAVINEMVAQHTDGLFIKDSSLSSKDKIEKIIKETAGNKARHAAKEIYPHIPVLDPTTFSFIYSREAAKLYAIKSPEEAFERLLGSEKLKSTLDIFEVLNKPFYLCVRPFDTRIRPDCELRHFVLFGDECGECLDEEAYSNLKASRSTDKVVSDLFKPPKEHQCAFAGDFTQPKLMGITSYSAPEHQVLFKQLPAEDYFSRLCLRMGQQSITANQQAWFPGEKTRRTVVDICYLGTEITVLTGLKDCNFASNISSLILDYTDYSEVIFIERNNYVRRPLDTILNPREYLHIEEVFLKEIGFRAFVNCYTTLWTSSAAWTVDNQELSMEQLESTVTTFRREGGEIGETSIAISAKLTNQANDFEIYGNQLQELVSSDPANEPATKKLDEVRKYEKQAKDRKLYLEKTNGDEMIKDVFRQYLDPQATTGACRFRWDEKLLFVKASKPEVRVSLKDYYAFYLTTCESRDVIPATFPEFEIAYSQGGHETLTHEMAFLNTLWKKEEQHATEARAAIRSVKELISITEEPEVVPKAKPALKLPPEQS